MLVRQIDDFGRNGFAGAAPGGETVDYEDAGGGEGGLEGGIAGRELVDGWVGVVGRFWRVGCGREVEVQTTEIWIVERRKGMG